VTFHGDRLPVRMDERSTMRGACKCVEVGRRCWREVGSQALGAWLPRLRPWGDCGEHLCGRRGWCLSREPAKAFTKDTLKVSGPVSWGLGSLY